MSNQDTASHDEFYKSLLGDFLGESEHLLAALNENLLRLDEWIRSPNDGRQRPPAETVLGELFRSAHSLKGLSNMLGLDEIENLVHHVEKILDATRKDQLAVTGDVVAILFEAIDRLGNLIDALKDVDTPAIEYESLLERIVQMLRAAGAEPELAETSQAERTLRRIEAQVARALDGTDASLESPTLPQGPPHDTNPLAVPPLPARATTAAKQEGEDPFDGLMDDADMSSRFVPIFIDETGLALDQLTETLLAFEGAGSVNEIRRLLVIAHRIKGSAAAVGLNRSAKLAHFMEDLLQNLVDTGQTLSADVTDAMLKCVDELRSYVDGRKHGSIPADRFPKLAAELLRARRQAAAPEPMPPAAATESPPAAPVPLSKAAPDEPPGEVSAGQPAHAAPHAEECPLKPICDRLRHNVVASAPMGLPVYAGVATFQPGLALVGLKTELLYEKLSGLGDVCYFDPPPEKFDAIEKLDCIRFGLATERSEQQIRAALKTAGVLGAIVEPLSREPAGDALADSARGSAATSQGISCDAKLPGGIPAASLPRAAAAEASAPPVSPAQAAGQTTLKDSPIDRSGKPTETLRVDVDRLDQLMNLAGQLVVSKARFAQISDFLRSVLGNKRSMLALDSVLQSLAHLAGLEEGTAADHQALQAEFSAVCAQARRIQGQLEPVRREVESFYKMHSSITELEEAVHQLARGADEIQKNVMDTRMVPIGPLFTRFHRVIRDITRASGKSIRLVIHGENTELDKRMIDELGDPLIHLVRNSADHGIEPADVRIRAGKPPEGTITLDAFHRGNSVLVQIRDDGRGLDPSHILAKALERGFVSAREADRMTTQQIYNLIWQPGFSTAQQVTEVSGRGIGMDIVRSRVESLNGSVELDSTPGGGTSVTIKLPLTLAILPSLMVEVGGDVFAMPLESVAEIVKVTERDIATVHGRRAAMVRGRVVSVVALDDVFHWKAASPPNHHGDGAWTLVIVGEGEEEIGLVIDRVIGEEDVVIKSMAENFRNVPGIAGASVLGNGRVSLILDLPAVIAMVARPATAVNLA